MHTLIHFLQEKYIHYYYIKPTLNLEIEIT